jgi:hypothetical protein
MSLLDSTVSNVAAPTIRADLSGLLESLQQLGASLGVAVLGTIFFSGIGAQPDMLNFVNAARQVTLLTIGLTLLTFVVGFFLPKRA